MNKGIGIAALVAGLVLLYFGYNEAQSVGSKINEAFSGTPTDRSLFFYIGGAALVAFGGYSVFK